MRFKNGNYGICCNIQHYDYHLNYNRLRPLADCDQHPGRIKSRALHLRYETPSKYVKCYARRAVALRGRCEGTIEKRYTKAQAPNVCSCEQLCTDLNKGNHDQKCQYYSYGQESNNSNKFVFACLLFTNNVEDVENSREGQKYKILQHWCYKAAPVEPEVYSIMKAQRIKAHGQSRTMRHPHQPYSPNSSCSDSDSWETCRLYNLNPGLCLQEKEEKKEKTIKGRVYCRKNPIELILWM